MKNFLLPAACIVTGATAFIIGRQTASPSGSAPTEQVAVEDERPRFRSSDRVSGGSAGAFGSRSLRSQASGQTEETIEDKVRDIALLSDPLERNQALIDLLNNASTSEDFLEIVSAFRGLGMTQERMGDYGIMLAAWAQVDPLGALDYAKEETGTPFARQTILTSWAGYDPDSAIAWAEENHDGDGANIWMVGVIEGLASSDIDRATQLAVDLGRSRERGRALEFLVQQVSTREPAEALAWTRSIDVDENFRHSAMAEIAKVTAERDLDATVSWLDSLADDPGARRRAVDEVTAVWAKEDVQGAIAYVDKLPLEERGQAAEGIMREYADQDPVAAAAYLDSLAGTPDLDEATRNFVYGAAGENPALAANYIGQIENERQRQRAYWRVGRTWANQDREAALEWLQTTEGVPERLIRRLNGNNGG